MSACSAREASRIASAGSPSQIRNVACTPLFARRANDLQGTRLQAIALLVHPAAETARQVQVVRLDHAQDDQGGVLVNRELDRLTRSSPRRPRLVDRQEDPSSHWVCRRFHRSSLAERRRRTMSQPARSVGPTGPQSPRSGTGTLLP